MAVANVNGALVGGASLKAADFLAIAAGLLAQAGTSSCEPLPVDHRARQAAMRLEGVIRNDAGQLEAEPLV